MKVDHPGIGATLPLAPRKKQQSSYKETELRWARHPILFHPIFVDHPLRCDSKKTEPKDPVDLHSTCLHHPCHIRAQNHSSVTTTFHAFPWFSGAFG